MIEKLIKNTAQQLDQQKIPYMIIGGQAVLLYGRPRLTRDIDITLGIDTDKYESIENVCNKLKLKILVEKPQNFARDTKVLPAEEPDSKVRIDFIFSFTPYEEQAIKNAKEVLIDDYPAKFASCEDIIIHKMVAGRAIDEEDVKSILTKNKDTIDFEYVNNWLSEFGKIAEHEGILERFNSLLKK
ncbi:MAG: nucleotidyl transferase AbiEii/AbiGii toxin family protein [Planctomycetota bacterium]|jgi:predicted nucleotidyltransferase